MNAVIAPGRLSGVVGAVASKSMAHRLLILATLANQPCEFRCNTTSEDIQATARCLEALQHVRGSVHTAELDCGESGSTLRFLLPVACALDAPVRFIRHGRLAARPLTPLDRELRKHGATLAEHGDVLEASGPLRAGRFLLPGNVSSQYVSGLLMAATVLDDPTEVLVEAPVQSWPYVTLTIRALELFGQDVAVETVTHEGVEHVRLSITPVGLTAPEVVTVEGDWSNAAFWLAAGAQEAEGITVTGLDLESAQGDRAILGALAGLGTRIARRGGAARATYDNPRPAKIDVSAIPDLVPPLAAVMTTTPGTSRLVGAARLRLKESDRLESVSAAINALGGRARALDDELVIEGVEQLRGGIVDAQNDHRIAMMAAIMATHAQGPVTIIGAQCVAKSYPTFWEDYVALGGSVALDDKSEE